ncbi:MAG: hypothetical protein JST93_27005 [Acidobacteria bacterium]|nr:hypothetical protein [Acidobacteriota bacterium]
MFIDTRVRTTGSALIIGTLLIVTAGLSEAQISNVVVTSSASFQHGYPGPGSLATVFCTGIPGITATTLAQTFPLPRQLAGVTVTIGGIAAPILAVSAGEGFQQINVQIPIEALDFTLEGVPVVVRAGGVSSTAVARNLTSSPGEFFRFPTDPRGTEPPLGMFQHAADYSLVTIENPAHPGENIIGYLTGVPVRTVPEVPTGEAAPASPLITVPRILEPPTPSGPLAAYFTVRFGDNPLKDSDSTVPAFFGLAPGLAGVFQLNFTVPSSWKQGSTPVVLNRQRYPVFGAGRLESTDSTPVFLPIAEAGQ